jgi:hypothetical protein
MKLMRSVYPTTVELMEWLNHALVPMEQPVFEHYRGIKHLIRIVDRAEAGLLPEYAARSAIRDYNEEHCTLLTYDEIRDRCTSYVFADFGQWAAYLDSIQAQEAIIAGAYDDPEEAFTHAPTDINWIVLLLPSNHVVVVYRSPHIGYKAIYDEDTHTVEGLSRGIHASYTLPPQIEASLGWADPEEITHQYRSHNER